MVNIYKCRAECLPDVIEFLRLIGVESFAVEATCPPDLVFTFTNPGDKEGRPLPLAELRSILDELTDCHVMAETLARASEYTGERRTERGVH